MTISDYIYDYYDFEMEDDCFSPYDYYDLDEEEFDYDKYDIQVAMGD